MRKLGCLLLVLAVLSAAGAADGMARGPDRKTVTGFYLDTVVTLSAYTDNVKVLDDALEECGRYERLLSRTIEGSDIWRINHAGGKPMEVSADTIKILTLARQVSEWSGGAFDVTIAPAAVLWDFRSGKAQLPDAEALEAAAALVDYTRVAVEGNTVTLPEGMMLDLGAIAKGYIADALKATLIDRGVKSGILSLGGNVVTIGTKPDGKPWKIGIQDIDGRTGEYMLVAESSGGATVTSGTYERGFDLDGVHYHHLLDASSGWPVQNGLASVSIFCEDSALADALSTAAFLLGPEKGLALIESTDGAEAVFIRNDRTIICSSGAERYLAA